MLFKNILHRTIFPQYYLFNECVKQNIKAIHCFDKSPSMKLIKTSHHFLMCEEIIHVVEMLISTMNGYIDDNKEKEANNEFFKHFQNVESLVIDIAKSVSSYRSFCGTNPHFVQITHD